METYIELTEIYAEIMDQVYYRHLRQYFTDTGKFIKKAAKGTDLLFSEKQSLSSKQDSSALNQSQANNTMDFNETIMSTTAREQLQADVEDRASILERIDSQPIVIAISQSKKQQFHFEEVFRSQNKLIVDAVCKEFVFVLEFFDLKMMQVSNIFNQIFSRVINKYLEWLAQYNSPSATQSSLAKTVQKAASSATSAGASTSGGIDVYAILLCI